MSNRYYSIDPPSWQTYTGRSADFSIITTTGTVKYTPPTVPFKIPYSGQLPPMHPALQSLSEWVLSHVSGDPCWICQGNIVAIERMALTVKCVHPVRGEINHSAWDIAKWLSALTPPTEPVNEPEWGEYGL